MSYLSLHIFANTESYIMHYGNLFTPVANRMANPPDVDYWEYRYLAFRPEHASYLKKTVQELELQIDSVHLINRQAQVVFNLYKATQQLLEFDYRMANVTEELTLDNKQTYIEAVHKAYRILQKAIQDAIEDRFVAINILEHNYIGPRKCETLEDMQLIQANAKMIKHCMDQCDWLKDDLDLSSPLKLKCAYKIATKFIFWIQMEFPRGLYMFGLVP